MVGKKIYICYSEVQEDVNLFNSLIIHIGINRRLQLWYSGMTNPGDNFIERENFEFEQCEVFMPVLTVNFLNNKSCFDRLKMAMESGKKIIPLFARSFDLDAVRELDQIKEQIILNTEKPLDRHEDLNGALREVSTLIRERIFGEKRSKKRFFPETDTKGYYLLLASLIFFLALFFLISGFLFEIDKEFTLLGFFLILLTSLPAIAKITFPTNVDNDK